MNTIPFKSARVRNAVKVAIGATAAVPLMFCALPASAATTEVGQTKIDISGFVRFDTHYDFEGDQGSTLLPSDVLGDPKTEYGAADHDADMGSTVAWSRLRIKTTTPTSAGDVGGYIEADFHGDGDSGSALRVRQAYITYGNWLIGKAWTTFENFHYGNTLDFAGPAGQVFGRKKQVRYTVNLGNGNNFAVALEQDDGFDVGSESYVPGTGVVVSNPATETSTPLPILTMRYQGKAGMFGYQAAALGREIKAQNSAGVEDQTFGWGLNLGGTLSLQTGTTFMVSAAYGEGIGGYIYTADFGPVAYFDGDSLETNKELGLIGSVSQKLTDKLTANLVYGYSQAKRSQAEDKVTGQSIAVNLMYSPVKPLVLGVGYERATAKYEDGNSGDTLYHGAANRISFAAIYNF